MEILGRVLGKPKKLSPSELHKQSVASAPFYKERPANRKAAKAEARERKFQEQQARLQRENVLAAERAKLAQQRAAKVTADRKRGNLATTIVSGVNQLAGKKTRRSAMPSKGRAVYVSTSHGLKRIYPDDPRYAQAATQTMPPQPQRVAVRESDDNEQPAAFRGL